MMSKKPAKQINVILQIKILNLGSNYKTECGKIQSVI